MAVKGRKPGRKAGSKGRGRPAAKTGGKHPVAALEDLRKHKMEQDAAYAEQLKKLLKDALAARSSELATAKQQYKAAAERIAALEGEIDNLETQLAKAPGSTAPAAKAPVAKPARKGAKKGAKKKAKPTRKSAKKAAAPAAPAPAPAAKKAGKKAARKGGAGRRASVAPETKTSILEDILRNFPDGVSWYELRKTLMSTKVPGTAKKAFTTADLNSAKVFANKLLPKGYKVVGQRKSTKVVKG